MDLIVAPNGVALSEEAQQQAQNPPLLWTLAGVAGALIRATRDPGQTVELGVHVARSDDVAIVWLIERWVLHASDLRAGTLSMFCEIVRRSRAKSALANQLGMSRGQVTVPRYMMSLLARDEGIPVGIIVQTTDDPAPLPMADLRLPGDVQSMWLASAYCNIVARLGEPALQAALAAVAELRAAHQDSDAFHDRAADALAQLYITSDEAIACLVLEEWHRERGAAELAALRAMIAP
ncbi:MAG TPA: hypothetical protein VNO30_17530 [Kofleriaceae bacterium]|nr:hypothetical protein [Kofleriaceae bacterium]